MNKSELEERRQAVEQRFNELSVECNRLQGEYRLLGEQLAALEPSAQNVSKEANKLDIKELDNAKTS